ncbi:hypothetical protein BVRB_1g017480 [Beta vulgaris subsp. vulgaris]|nr:hypothetical protein BVRB_1g017480 [Beta vulgaris subsp. vulgaris]
MKMKIKVTHKAFAAFFHGDIGITHFPSFTFQFNYCNYSNEGDVAIEDRELFMKSVQKQSELGFCNFNFSLSLFHLFHSLYLLPSEKLNRLQPHPTLISLLNHYTVNTLINGGVIYNDKLPRALQLLDQIVKQGFQPKSGPDCCP